MNETISQLSKDGYSIHFTQALYGGVVVNVLHPEKANGFYYGYTTDPHTALCLAVDKLAGREHKLAGE